MAYNEQVFTNLGVVQQPNPALAENFGVATPFVLSDTNEKLLGSITDDIIKRKRAEKEELEKNLESKVKSVSAEIQGIEAWDYDVLKEKQNSILDFMAKNPEALSRKSPEKSRELNQMFVDFNTMVGQAKATKKYSTALRDLMKSDSDYNNEVNLSLVEDYEKTPLTERIDKTFYPIKNRENDFLKTHSVNFYKNMGTSETFQEDIVGDDGSYIVGTKMIYDPNAYFQIYKANNGDYIKREWEMRKANGQYVPETADEYIRQKSDAMFTKEIVLNKQKVVKNQQYATESRADENQIKRDFTAEQNAKKAELQVRLQAMRNMASQQNKENYPIISSVVENIENFDGNLIANIDVATAPAPIKSALGKSINEYKSIKEVEPTFINANIVNRLYSGGRSLYGEGYGKLFIMEDNKGNLSYVPATEKYYDNGKEITKAEYKQYVSLGNAEKKGIVAKAVPDMSRKFSREDLVRNTVTNTKAGLNEFSKWSNEVEAVEKEIKAIDTPQPKTNTLSGGYNFNAGKPHTFNAKVQSEHADHAHISTYDANSMVRIIEKAKEMGLNVRGNDYAGVNTHSKYTSEKNPSHHGMTFKEKVNEKNVSMGVDIGHGNKPEEINAFLEWYNGQGLFGLNDLIYYPTSGAKTTTKTAPKTTSKTSTSMSGKMKSFRERAGL